jgi:hypothetical protein
VNVSREALRAWLVAFGPPVATGVIYLVAIGLIAWCVVRPREVTHLARGPIAYHAARKLPENTRLRPEHLVRPPDLPLGYFRYLPAQAELEARYLAKDRDPHNAILVSDTRPWPRLPPPTAQPRITLVSLRDQPAAALVNAGTVVDIHSAGDGEPVRTVSVLTVLCDNTGALAACHAVVAVPDAVADRLSKAQGVRILVKGVP